MKIFKEMIKKYQNKRKLRGKQNLKKKVLKIIFVLDIFIRLIVFHILLKHFFMYMIWIKIFLNENHPLISAILD